MVLIQSLPKVCSRRTSARMLPRSSAIAETGNVQCEAIEAAKIAVTSARADNMRGNEEPRSFYKAAIERVAQIDCRPFRIDAAEIAQGREAVVHVFAGETQLLEHLGRGRLSVC